MLGMQVNMQVHFPLLLYWVSLFDEDGGVVGLIVRSQVIHARPPIDHSVKSDKEFHCDMTLYREETWCPVFKYTAALSSSSSSHMCHIIRGDSYLFLHTSSD